MKTNKTLLNTITFFIICSLSLETTSINAKTNDAGKVIFSFGDGSIKGVDNKLRSLKKGATLRSGDEITTKARTRVQIKLKDGSFFSIKPNTQFQIKSFIYKKSIKEDRSFFGLIKGGFRALTGLIGSSNKKSYRVTTPVATIGIRGTDFDLALLKEDGNTATKLVTFTNNGEIILSNEAGTQFFGAGEAGFVPANNRLPRKATPQEANLLVINDKDIEKQNKERQAKQEGKAEEQTQKRENIKVAHQKKKDQSFDRWSNVNTIISKGIKETPIIKIVSWITGEDKFLPLPAIGTASYSLDGNPDNYVLPSDSAGNVGVYQNNKATLTADFSNSMVTKVEVDTQVSGNQWKLESSNAVAIKSDGTFKFNNDNLIKTGSPTSAKLEGVFTGAESINAAIMFNMKNKADHISGAANLIRGEITQTR